MNFKLIRGQYRSRFRRSYETIQSIQCPIRYLTAFNYVGLNLNETPQELKKCTPEFQNFLEKECREHNQSKLFNLL